VSRHARHLVYVLAITSVVFAAFLRAHAQTIHHDIGQDVAPLFEGWEQNPDGSYNFVFGYLNRNYVEQLDIAVGPENFFDNGSQDRGQPTHFYPRRGRFVFRVQVPKEWDKNRRLVWTLISRGKTNQAKGWLQPEWELNPGVISENSGGGVIEPGNQPPKLTGSFSESVAVSAPLTLTVNASDDGLPKPRPRRRPQPDSAAAAAALQTAAALANPDTPIRTSEGMRVKWVHYRGPGKVTFDPDSAKPEYKPAATYTTTAKFSEPGTYIVRVVVSDGQLEAARDITVSVR
jgi:hypothetical protein